MEKLTVEDFINAFTETYEYDAIDERDIQTERFVSEIEEKIEDFEGTVPSKSEIAEIVYDILYMIQYGDTSDVDNCVKIRDDIHSRFPNGR